MKYLPILIAATILATFLYQPTLDWHVRTWADPIMGVKR